MLGTKIYKTDMSSYTDCALWCNANSATIEDKGEYYEVVAIPEPSVEEVKAAKINELKAVRDTKEVESVQTDKGVFDYDDKSRDRLAIARQALTDAGGGEIVWTTADNQRVSMGIADFAAINGAAAVRSNALHTTYRALKAQVQAAETVDDVNNIMWPEDQNARSDG